MQKLPYSMKRLGNISDSELSGIRADLSGQDWARHLQPDFSVRGNWFIPVKTTNGGRNNNHEQPFLPTKRGKNLKETLKLCDSLGITPLRTRFMKIEEGGIVPLHYDEKGWDDKARLHIPIYTHPSIEFQCGRQSEHMAEGEVWIIDNYDLHGINNNSPIDRIHLVIDIFIKEIHLAENRFQYKSINADNQHYATV